MPDFDMAKRLIRRLEVEHGLSAELLEKVTLATSREFYDNAETGNIYTGDMKLAYEWYISISPARLRLTMNSLNVVPSSPSIRHEREFIEATSRLCSFNFSITPIEIRHSKNKLDLIRRVLSSSGDAHRHADIVLELTDKLGYRGDTVARVEVLAMLADAAVQATEFERAYEHCQAMVTLATSRGADRAKLGEVCCKTCLELGHQSEYADVGNKMTLLGQAVELCPAERIPDILGTWKRVEDGQIRLDEAAKRRRLTGINSSTFSRGSLPNSPNRADVQEARVLGSRTAARAARLAMDLGERFNLRQLAPSPLLGGSPLATSGGGVSPEIASDDERRTSAESDRPIAAMFNGPAEAERVRHQARRAVLKGVGWLLGADEKEVTG